MSGCYKFIKFLFVLINFVFWVLGIAIVAIAAWMITDPTFYLSMTQDEVKYYTGLYVFLAAGGLLVIVSFLGCCGAVKESQCMLVSFFCVIFIGVVMQVAAAWWCAAHAGHLEKQVRATVQSTVRTEYDGYNSRTMAFDAIQRGLKCCGANGPNDWSGSLYSKNMATKTEEGGLVSGLESLVDSLGLSAGGGKISEYIMPPSCCTMEGTLCETSRRSLLTASINPLIHSTGCIDRVLEAISSNMNIVIGVGIGVAVLEILALVFSITLCCAVNRSDRYKA
ncbi:tetraspanin 96F [Arctopsyche grandis]|uniref:tetraspanin 96F n=1 Tax=Arctopsyche grandis TaxID=121162 RepID=UPI00406DA025